MADGTDFLDKEYFFFLLDNCFFNKVVSNRNRNIDAITSSIILTSYALNQYQLAENHFSLFQACSSLAASIIRFAVQEKIPLAEIKDITFLIRIEILRHLKNLAAECFQREHFLEGDGDLMYKARATIVLSSMALSELVEVYFDANHEINENILEKVKSNVSHLWFWGDSAFPFFFTLIKFLEIAQETDLATQTLEELVTDTIASASKDGEGIPGPYFEPSHILEYTMGSEDYEIEWIDFSGESYSLETIVEMTAARNNRKILEKNWRLISHIMYTEFKPELDIDFFTWRTDKGDNQSTWSPEQQSWKNLRAKVEEEPTIPDFVKLNPDIALAFLYIAPQRGNTFLYRLLGKTWKL